MENSNVLKSHLSNTPVIVICTKKDSLINEVEGKALDKIQETGTVTDPSQLANQAYAQAEAAFAIVQQEMEKQLHMHCADGAQLVYTSKGMIQILAYTYRIQTDQSRRTSVDREALKHDSATSRVLPPAGNPEAHRRSSCQC